MFESLFLNACQENKPKHFVCRKLAGSSLTLEEALRISRARIANKKHRIYLEDKALVATYLRNLGFDVDSGKETFYLGNNGTTVYVVMADGEATATISQLQEASCLSGDNKDRGLAYHLKKRLDTPHHAYNFTSVDGVKYRIMSDKVSGSLAKSTFADPSTFSSDKQGSFFSTLEVGCLTKIPLFGNEEEIKLVNSVLAISRLNYGWHVFEIARVDRDYAITSDALSLIKNSPGTVNVSGIGNGLTTPSYLTKEIVMEMIDERIKHHSLSERTKRWLSGIF